MNARNLIKFMSKKANTLTMPDKGSRTKALQQRKAVSDTKS
jgi:hypothetical protein